MSDASAFGFGKFIPGFDFLQNLAQSAGKAQPGAAPSWVAPTLSVEELDKRIQDLKAVQFWLEQNVTTLKATIQAMEVQKMTLATLQGMNVNMADLAKAFAAKPEAAAPAADTPTPEPQPAAQAEPATPNEETKKATRQSKAKAADKPMVDPMAWWGSLSQQFQNIAATAMKDVAAEAMKAKASAEPAAAEPSPAASKPARKAAAKKTAAKKPANKKAAK